MHIPFADVIQLLHRCTFGALATHSRAQPGYPFATVLPFVPDHQHRPVFLISGLAEHTRNIRDNPRASFLVFEPGAEDVQTGARLTIVGEMAPISPDPALRARFLRYRPDAERLLELGDFAFFYLEPRQLRYIGGFGQMGWVEAPTPPAAMCLDAAAESMLLSQTPSALPKDITLLGIDPLGADLSSGPKRIRCPWPGAPLAPNMLEDMLAKLPEVLASS